MPKTIEDQNLRLFEHLRGEDGVGNQLIDSYLRTPQAAKWRAEFESYGTEHEIRLRYPRDNDKATRQGDLLVLKPYIGPEERGVLLVQYNDSFKKLISVFDVHSLSRKFRIVLEPSTWGYCDPAILMLANLGTDVIVEAQYEPDFEFIRSLNSSLIPIRIGAGDWIDPNRFQALNDDEKEYDVVMVASWQKIKRHDLLFRALSRCGGVVRRVALIGYPAEGRTKDDVAREARKHRVQQMIEIYEGITREEVSRIVRKSRIGVMLTIREGSNKGIYECLFSGVPVILSSRNIGVNRDHINSKTGIVSNDYDLERSIRYLLENVSSFAPREWVLRETGYVRSSRRLNDLLRSRAFASGEAWTEDIYQKKNDTNAQYVFEEDRVKADHATKELRGCLWRYERSGQDD